MRSGERLDDADLEVHRRARPRRERPDQSRASRAGFLLAVLVVACCSAWIWRFRPELWHRNNVLLLIGLLLVGATLALKLTAGRDLLGFFLPTAAIGMLLADPARRLDRDGRRRASSRSSAGAVNGASLEFAAYVFLGGHGRHRRRPPRRPLQVFVQAAIAVFVVNALVVSVFSLLGDRDLQGVLELWFASAIVGGRARRSPRSGRSRSSARVFGILTVFQLLELANPSQPLLRRLLVETPGTYHHSLMVGNLAERAAEAIGADPLRDARRGLLPRRRQALEPARVHREPGGRRERPRPARARGRAPRSSSSTSPTGSTSPTRPSCRRR